MSIIELNCVNTTCMCGYMFDYVCVIYHVMLCDVLFQYSWCDVICILYDAMQMLHSMSFKIHAAVSCDIILMMSYLLYSMDGHLYIMHVTVLIETLIRPINRQWSDQHNRQWSALHIVATLIYLQSWLDMELIRKWWIMYV